MTLAPNDTTLSKSDPSETDSAAGANPSAPEATDTLAPAKTNGDSQSDAARMFRLFEGLDTHHGYFDHTKAKASRGKPKVEIGKHARTVKSPPNLFLWQRHIDGEYSLGVCPVRSDGTSSWWTIDIDNYLDLSHRDLAKRIADVGLPLLVCKSKSGGAHVFLFLAEPAKAADVRCHVEAMLAILGLPDTTEIFPKKDMPDGSGWLNMPYFDTERGHRYAVDAKGRGLSIKRFLDAAEAGKVAAADLAGLIAKAKQALETDSTEEGPGGGGSDEAFAAWLDGALPLVENAPPTDADDSLWRLAKDVGRYIGEVGIDITRSDIEDVFLWGLRIGEIKSRSMESWKTRKGTLDRFDEQWANGLRAGVKEGNPPWPRRGNADDGVVPEDFYAYMEQHNFIFRTNRRFWPAASVDARLGKIGNMKASVWLAKNRPVEQMTWAPGYPELIRDKLVVEGGWIEKEKTNTYNLYIPPTITLGDAKAVRPWLDHVEQTYGDDSRHLVQWFAHRRQRPGEKVNHALVFGGAQGIGKDTILEPVKSAVGAWNFLEVQPAHLFASFNPHVKSVILRISEAHDLGDTDRYALYERVKVLAAAPPDVHRCNEKNLREHAVMNVTGVIFTTNHKTDGIYLPADDRRHFVAWSDRTKEDFSEAYWNCIWGWFADGGRENVAAYLDGLDLEGFDAKAPPPKTAAFYDIVDANRAQEDSEMADTIEQLQYPAALTVEDLRRAASAEFQEYLSDRRSRRQIPHRMEAAGYVRVRSDTASGEWKIDGRYQSVYAKRDLSVREQRAAAALRGSPI
ncbi:primase-helicase family protein [Rhizobium sp.]